MTGQLIIRADAGPRIGTGHVMRCLALAEAWQKAGQRVHFLSSALPSSLQKRLETSGLSLTELKGQPGSAEDATTLRFLARELKADWLVIDGYHFDSSYQGHARNSGTALCLVSDYAWGAGGAGGPQGVQLHAQGADLVVDQNLGTEASLYQSLGKEAVLLLGPRYALLRQEFGTPAARETTATGRRLLITMGGADPSNGTRRVLEALAILGRREWQVTVVVGPANPFRAELEAFVLHQRLPVRFVVDASHMSQLMAEADVAVAAAGSTVWELCCAGLPGVLIVVAENQRRNASELENLGAALNAGDLWTLTAQGLSQQLVALLEDPVRRSEISARGRTLVDGRGAFRVWRQMNERQVVLRDALPTDCQQVWEWTNAPEVRAVSFSSEPIPWATHQEWFRARLEASPGKFWLAFTSDGRALGQVRFDFSQDDANALVSVSMDSGGRGQGWGSLVLWTACRKLFAETSVDRIEARIKKDNVASQRAFAKAEFKFVRAEIIKNQPAVVYEWTRAAFRHA